MIGTGSFKNLNLMILTLVPRIYYWTITVLPNFLSSIEECKQIRVNIIHTLVDYEMELFINFPFAILLYKVNS